MKKLNLVDFGHSEKTHGIKGGFIFNLHNTEDSLLASLPKIFLKPRTHQTKMSQLKNEGEYYKLASIAFGNKVIAYLEGIDSIDAAEKLLPFDISVNRELFPTPDEDEIYLSDLFGFEVLDENQKLIGVLHEFYENSSQLVLVVKAANGELIDIPYVDEFVKKIEMENKKIHVIKPQWIE